ERAGRGGTKPVLAGGGEPEDQCEDEDVQRDGGYEEQQPQRQVNPDAEHLVATAQHGQECDPEHRQPRHGQQQQPAEPSQERVRPAVARHRPGNVQQVLHRLAQPERTVQRGDGSDDHRGSAALESLRPLKLATDDRKLVQRRVEDLVAQLRLALQDEPEDRGTDQQQREDRDERVVGDHRRQQVSLVVEELVDHRDREADHPVPSLEPVQRVRNCHAVTLPVDGGVPAQAVLFSAAVSSPSVRIESARISTLRTLPVTVIGNSSTTSTYRGILCRASLPAQNAATPSASSRFAPGRSTTQAHSSSPYAASGTPITCTST